MIWKKKASSKRLSLNPIFSQWLQPLFDLFVWFYCPCGAKKSGKRNKLPPLFSSIGLGPASLSQSPCRRRRQSPQRPTYLPKWPARVQGSAEAATSPVTGNKQREGKRRGGGGGGCWAEGGRWYSKHNNEKEMPGISSLPVSQTHGAQTHYGQKKVAEEASSVLIKLHFLQIQRCDNISNRFLW